MNENEFKKDIAAYDKDRIIISCLKKLENKFLKGYHDVVSLMADPFINAAKSKRIEKVSFEFSQFLSEIEKEIQDKSIVEIPMTDNVHTLNELKNNFIDSLFPEEKFRGRSDYNTIMGKKAKAADKLETLLLTVYNIGLGERRMTIKEEDKIDNKWRKKCRDDLETAYNKGTGALTLMLKAACADGNAMELLNKE